MKKKILISASIILILLSIVCINNYEKTSNSINESEQKTAAKLVKKKKKTLEERALFHEARVLDEFKRLADPNLGEIPKIEQVKELAHAQSTKQKTSKTKKTLTTSFVNRGASNLGGRTRTIVVDRSDGTGNTIIAGGVSGGVFRTTNGGTSWTKVSPFDDIYNVTTIIQDPRAGFENVWYYGTGEGLGASTSIGASLNLGRGIWQSTDGGINWSQFTGTDSTQETLDTTFDLVYNLAIDPTTGYLYAAVLGQVQVYLPSPPVATAGWFNVQAAASCCNTLQATDVAITDSGQIYISIGAGTGDANSGVWSTNDVFTPSTQISSGEFVPSGRIVLGIAPSNQNKVYALFVNGDVSSCDTTPAIEADLYMWNQTSGTWTDYSTKLPDEVGCSDGNDPFAVQGGYDLVVSVKPNDENFVVIGGTNAYKKEDITTAGTFTRIGGYASSTVYDFYSVGGTEHHADLHALVFNPFNNDILFSGSDGGIHKTNDITAASVAWTSLNNNYQTQQYFHVAIDPQSGSDFVIGGLQDNGTNTGGISAGESNLTEQTRVFSGDGVAVGISRDNANVPTFVGFQNGPIYRRNKNLSPFFGTEITPDGSSSQFVTYFFLDPDNNKTLYYAGEDKVYRTNNATTVTSTSWTDMKSPSDITDGGSGTEWPQIFSTTRGVYNSGTSYLLIGTNEGNIYRLSDPQNAADISGAIKITPTGATTVADTYVSGLAIHPTNPDIVLATYSNYGVESIYLTTNATNAIADPTWTLVERNLPSHSIRSSAIFEVSGQTYYFVGTGRGLYSTTDPTSTDWTIESPNEIGFALVRSLAARPVDNRLLIGTHGNGMYETTVTHVLGTKEAIDISNEIAIYPNPAVNEIKINLPAKYGTEIEYNIIDLGGQSILKGQTSKSIDISNLNIGIYFIKVSTGNVGATKKIIKI